VRPPKQEKKLQVNWKRVSVDFSWSKDVSRRKGLDSTGPRPRRKRGGRGLFPPHDRIFPWKFGETHRKRESFHHLSPSGGAPGNGGGQAYGSLEK